MSDVNFQDDQKSYKEMLKAARAELAELEKQLKAYDLQTQRCRDSIATLRDAIDGKVPATPRATRGKVEPLSINEETNRPPRGDRRRQIELICKKLGRGGKTFRAIEVINELQHVEGVISDGMRSYTYSVLGTLEADEYVEKQGRGLWRLK